MVNTLSLRFQQCLGQFSILLVEGLSETGRFRQLSNHIFGVRNFGNISAMRVNFFKRIPNLIYISKIQKTFPKNFLVFEVIAYELVALNCFY